MKPKPGDVFKLPNDHRELEVARVNDTVYVYVLGRSGKAARTRYAFCSLVNWPRIVAGASVLSRAV